MVHRAPEDLEAVSLYQLVGPQGYPPGRLVTVCGPWHTYGRVQAIVKPKYVVPNPCVVDGPKGFPKGAPLTLYLIRGIEKNEELPTFSREAWPVWGFTS